jgi:hypothetical protein
MPKLHLIPLNQDANDNYTQARCSGSGAVCEGPLTAENIFHPDPIAIKTNLQAQFENHANEIHPGEHSQAENQKPVKAMKKEQAIQNKEEK